MNNVIFILVDSVFSKCIGSNKTEESSTPFIDGLIKEGMFADNVYSYAPYTDAATIGLYCGIPTLESFGYYFGINHANYNHFRVFKDNGYETYGFYYPYYLISKKTKQYVDHSIYTAGFKYGSVWFGKLEYYAIEKKNRELTEKEYSLIEKCLEMMFECWLGFYDDLKNSKDSDIIVNNLKFNDGKATGEKGLVEQFKEFCIDKKKYVDDILDKGMAHPIAHINDYDFGSQASVDNYKIIFKKYKKDLSRIHRKNIKLNLRNNHLSFTKSFKSIMSLVGLGDKKRARYIQNYGMLLSYNKMMMKRALKGNNWQEVSSLNKQVETLLQLIKERNSDKPFYFSLHVDEPHHNISYFSFDSFDDKLIQQEFDYLRPVVDNCGKKFKGNLIYQLSLRYVDLCIKRLFASLQEMNILDNTTVVLVSDHGTSYSFDPIRTNVVNTFHSENYNIPLLIWDKKINSNIMGSYHSYYSSEDILPTVLSFCGLCIPQQFKGKIIFNDISGRDYVITEYMGPGVPDMISREMWISIRNKNYVIAYKNLIGSELDLFNPCVIYELCNDKKELKNLKNKKEIFNNEEVIFLLSKIKDRYNEIRDNTKRELIHV